ncbi:nitrate- and nitrite sensing domain-containing protein [Tatumella sp. JGM130]|uniref:nitrate regulatory protein n=1 Tax=Tatumella sp. JGM130 TaxID=2799797 RepID=UPI001BB041E8|nr:nitrate regulatory protein [Tatumella sp. JGM130]MBS0895029.1 nitrate- and nitrite sensing domain-containing protein [Tatumella sp. JGM130]
MTDYLPATLRFLQASRQCELNSLRYLLGSGELVGKVSILIHHLQRERGAVHLYLCSEGPQAATELRDREQDALGSQQDVIQFLENTQIPDPSQPQASRLFSSAARVIYALGVLQETRQQVTVRAIPLVNAAEGFNDAIRHLLSLVFTVSDTPADPVISQALIALFSFMQGKELAGQERAIGARIFSQHTPQTDHQRLAGKIIDLIERQEQHFATFTEFSDPLNRQQWLQMATDSEFERLRRVACTRRSVSDHDASQYWFRLATRRIDDMKRQEDNLQRSLMQLCRERIGAAEQACQRQQADIDTLKNALTDSDSGFSVFMGDGQQVSGWLPGEGLQPRLGQSLLSLLGQQSRRLDAQNQELSGLREALQQRKTVDSAKKLLMQHRQLSEDDAYKTLRQMAMDQNKKIAEIATALLSVAGVFADRS